MAGIPDKWSAYAADRSIANRNRLAEAHLSIVDAIARKMARKHGEIDEDDLRSIGAIALLDCIERFEPERGFVFSTFAGKRIKGAMLDHLRSIDFQPRLMRHGHKTIERLTERFGRRPTAAELVEETGCVQTTANRWLEDLPPRFQSLSQRVYDQSSRELHLSDMLEDGQAAIGEEFESKELLDRLCRGCLRNERLIIQLYEIDGFSMKETAAVLGVSESRVSQIRSALMRRLKAKIVSRGGAECAEKKSWKLAKIAL